MVSYKVTGTAGGLYPRANSRRLATALQAGGNTPHGGPPFEGISHKCQVHLPPFRKQRGGVWSGKE